MDKKPNKNFILVNPTDQIISDSIRCTTFEPHCTWAEQHCVDIDI